MPRRKFCRDICSYTPRKVIIHEIIWKLTMTLHDAQEFYNDLGGGSDEDLALATALSVDDIVQAVILVFSIRRVKIFEADICRLTRTETRTILSFCCLGRQGVLKRRK